MPLGFKRPKLTLRALMVLILCLAVWLGYRVHLAREQRWAVAAVTEYGGFVYYDWQFVNGKFARGRSPKAPAWLRRAIGDEYFQDVTHVNLVVGRTSDGTHSEVQRKSDDIIPRLAAFPALKSLSIKETQATDDAMGTIGKLRNLESLSMFDPVVTDAGMAKLSGLIRLKSLDMGNMDAERNPGRLTDETLRSLGAIPHLETLNLQGNRFSDRGLSHIRGMTDLRTLLVSNLVGGSDITDAGLGHLKKLTKLELLGIQGSKVTDAGMDSLKGLTRLEELWVKNMGNSVSDGAIQRLQEELPNLKSVR